MLNAYSAATAATARMACSRSSRSVSAHPCGPTRGTSTQAHLLLDCVADRRFITSSDPRTLHKQRESIAGGKDRDGTCPAGAEAVWLPVHAQFRRFSSPCTARVSVPRRMSSSSVAAAMAHPQIEASCSTVIVNCGHRPALPVDVPLCSGSWQDWWIFIACALRRLCSVIG